jgi:uncharacterized protein
VVLIVVVVIHAAAGWMFSSRIVNEAFTPAADVGFGDPTVTELVVAEVTYRSPVGEIDAWHIDGNRSQWIIHVHGKGASLEEAIPAAEALATDGYNQLIIGYRNDPGQPSDPSGYYRYGFTEWEDLAAAVDWAMGRGADQIAIIGYSTGAAIALSYHYKHPDAPVRSMVFDAPNVNMAATIDLAATQEELFLGIPVPFTVTEIAKTVSALRTSVNWAAIDYVRRIDGLTVPTLVFHGDADLTVPIETSREMAELRPQRVELVEIQGASHVGARDVSPSLYDQRIRTFIAGHWR